MANSHPRGQVAVETTIIIMILASLLILISTHLTFAKNKFEKMELTQEVKNENQRFHRKK